jgi:purine-binding chemotaxis protein CheW
MSNTSSTEMGSLAGRYLTIALGNESYGIAVLKVREIIRLQKITPVPQMPPSIKGVINLRGRVIPVVDLRIKFGFTAVDDERTCIVVVQIMPATGIPLSLGIVVDRVEEVLNLTGDQIAPTPEFGASIDTSYILGMAKAKGDVQTLLDIDRVVLAEVPSQDPSTAAIESLAIAAR